METREWRRNLMEDVWEDTKLRDLIKAAANRIYRRLILDRYLPYLSPEDIEMMILLSTAKYAKESPKVRNLDALIRTHIFRVSFFLKRRVNSIRRQLDPNEEGGDVFLPLHDDGTVLVLALGQWEIHQPSIETPSSLPLEKKAMLWFMEDVWMFLTGNTEAEKDKERIGLVGGFDPERIVRDRTLRTMVKKAIKSPWWEIRKFVGKKGLRFVDEDTAREQLYFIRKKYQQIGVIVRQKGR